MGGVSNPGRFGIQHTAFPYKNESMDGNIGVNQIRTSQANTRRVDSVEIGML